MPVEYYYDSELHAVVAHLSGVIKNFEVSKYFDDLLSDDTVPPGFVEIVDFGHADDFLLSYSDVQSFVIRVGELVAKKGHAGTLFYAPTDFSFGMASMFKAYSDAYGIRVDIYRDWREMHVVIESRLGEDQE